MSVKVNSISPLIFPVQRISKMAKDAERKKNFQEIVMKNKKSKRK
jgi:hypothetical protein